jgi:phospholipid/cholesterol/gamma-HCH transport system substrate-binding protein
VRGTIVKLALLTLAGLASFGWLAVQIGQLGGPAGTLAKTYTVKAAFTDATGIIPGDEVRLAGVRIGKVGGVSVDRGRAVVRLAIDRRFHVPRESRIELHWRNLLGQRFVQVVPPKDATPQSPPLAAGARVGTDRTGAAADLTYLLDNAEPLLADLDTDSVNRVMETLAAAMQGREATFGAAVDQSAQLVKTLSGRADAIGNSITQFATLLDAVAGHDEQVRQLLTSLGSTSQAIAAKSDDLGRAVGSSGELTATLARVLDASGADLDAVLGQARTLAGTLAAQKHNLAEGVRTLNWTPAAFIRATNAGDWINIYGRGFGVINTFFAEPRIGPNYSDVGPDDTKAPYGPLLGQPRAPLPAIPETQLGPITINPDPGTKAGSSSSSGLDRLLGPLAASGSGR